MDTAIDLHQVVQAQRYAALDDILSRWHWWCSREPAGHGFRAGGHATHGYQTPPSYHSAEDADEAVDALNEDAIMATVHHEIGQLTAEQQYVLHAHARCLCTGAAVWRHPRVAEERRDVALREAKTHLLGRLIKAGVIA